MYGMEIYLKYEQAEMYDEYECRLADALVDDVDPRLQDDEDLYIEVPFVHPERCVRSRQQ